MITRKQAEEEAKWLFDQLYYAESEESRAYYQGRIDQLAWVLRSLKLGSIFIDRDKVAK